MLCSSTSTESDYFFSFIKKREAHEIKEFANKMLQDPIMLLCYNLIFIKFYLVNFLKFLMLQLNITIIK